MRKTLSIITPTLNNEKDIMFFLKTIERQEQKGFLLEVLIVDGGSKDKTLSIAKKHNVKIINNPYVLADPGVNLGIKKARGDIFMVLAVDNIFYDADSLQKMVNVFDDKGVDAAFPLQSSLKKDSIYTKYINTFTDPFNHFVYGYAANGRTFKKIYKTITSNKNYDIYDYSSYADRPLIAVAQGFTVRAGFTRNRNSRFDDVLPVIELIDSKKHVAFVHSVKLYHHTVRDYKHFIRKQAWATINALQRKNYGISHRMDYLSSNQKLRIKLWPIYSLSIILPVIRAAYGSLKDREPMWLFHPILCIISAWTSVIGSLIYFSNRSYRLNRQK